MKLNIIKGATERIIMAVSNENSYTAKISRFIGATHGHVVKIIDLLEEENIVTKKKSGRINLIELTERGKQIQSHLKSIRSLLWAIKN